MESKPSDPAHIGSANDRRARPRQPENDLSWPAQPAIIPSTGTRFAWLEERTDPMRERIVAAIVFAWSLTVGWPAWCQEAAPPQAGAPPQVVSLSGCPIENAQTGCLIMLKKGLPYDISTAPAQIDPKHPNLPPAPPKVGYLGIKASGIVTPGTAGKCAQGARLDNITWQYTRLRCLKPF